MNCSTSHMAPHINRLHHAHRKGRSMDREPVYGSETIGPSTAVDSAICTGFNKPLTVFAQLCTPHRPKFYMPTFGNWRNNSKTAFICVYFDRQPTGKPQLLFIDQREPTRHNTGYLVCSTSLTSFVHTSRDADEQAVSSRERV